MKDPNVQLFKFIYERTIMMSSQKQNRMYRLFRTKDLKSRTIFLAITKSGMHADFFPLL